MRLFGSKGTRRYRQARTLRVEPLERRELLSIDRVLTSGGAFELRLVGDSGANHAEVRSGCWGGVTWLHAEMDGETLDCHRAVGDPFGIASIYFYGGGGDDYFLNCTNYYGYDSGIPCTAYGGTGEDTLLGGGGNDYLRGDYVPGFATWGFHADHIEGGGGDDVIYGDSGGDRLIGGAGRDTIRGGIGRDSILGGPEADWLYGDADNDYIFGEEGDDLAFGGSGEDRIYGQDGQDLLWGESDNDYLYGGWEDDTLYGGSGDDTLRGSYGDDVLYGDAGNDRLYGGENDDSLYGGSGSDELYGNQHDDTLVSIDDSIDDHLWGGDGFDSFWLDANSVSPAIRADSVHDADASESATNVHRVTRFANGADRTLDGDAIPDPTADSTFGRYYTSFARHPLFASTGPSENDIHQGALGDCWLLASMGAVARTNPNLIRQTVVSLGDGTYAVRLGGTTDGTTGTYYRVDADLPRFSARREAPVYAGLGLENSLWVAIVEKAYTYYHDGSNTYISLDSGDASEALAGLNAVSSDWSHRRSYSGAQGMMDDIGRRFDRGLAVVVNTGGTIAPGAPLVAGHAYTVVGVRWEGGHVTSVSLRNPHGPAGAAGSLVTVTGAQLFGSLGWVIWGDVG